MENRRYDSIRSFAVKVKHSWSKETQRIYKIKYIERSDNIITIVFPQHWMNLNLIQQLRRAFKNKNEKEFSIWFFPEYPKKKITHICDYVAEVAGFATVDTIIYCNFKIKSEKLTVIEKK